MKAYKSYDPAVKEAGTRRMLEEIDAPKDIAADLGVSLGTLYHWKSQAKKKAGRSMQKHDRRGEVVKYPDKVVREALYRLRQEGEPVHSISKKMGIARSTIHTWNRRKKWNYGVPKTGNGEQRAAVASLPTPIKDRRDVVVKVIKMLTELL